MRYTAGAALYGSIGRFEYMFEGARQLGKLAKTDSTARADIDAFMLNLSSGVVLHKPSKFKVSLAYKWYSGDETPGDKTYGIYSSLFSSGRPMGHMDYFPNAYYGSGHQDYILKVSGYVSKQLSLKGDFHRTYLQHGATVGDNTSRALGNEADLSMMFKYNSYFSIGTGYSIFFAEELMEPVIGDTVAHWFYITTQVQFRIASQT